MDNCDDYFTDELFLDDETLAVLDQEEQKFRAHSEHQPPPPKRQRTEAGWKRRAPPRSSSVDYTEDLPEISVQGDGTYGLGTLQIVSGPSKNAQSLASKAAVENVKQSSQRDNPSVLHASDKESSIAISHGNHQAPHQSRPNNRRQQSSANLSRSSSSSQPFKIGAQASFMSNGPQDPSVEQLKAEIEALRSELEESQSEKSKVIADLKQSKDGELAKMGEVAILRDNKAKTAQEHAAQLARLRATKEEVEGKVIQMQRQFKEELERMKTQHLFKQHEMETSGRKPPGSIMVKKVNRNVPPTPIPLPPQMHSWNTIERNQSNRAPARSPHRRRSDADSSESPTALRRRRKPSPEGAKRSALLPGFQNAFMTSSPVRPSQVHRGKGKEKEVLEYSKPVSGKVQERGRPILADPFLSTSHARLTPQNSPTRPAHHVDGDADMSDTSIADEQDIGNAGLEYVGMEADFDGEIEEEYATFVEESSRTRSIDRKEELSRIVLIHAVPLCNIPTVQILLKVDLPSTLPISLQELFSNASVRLLESLAKTSKLIELEEFMGYIAVCLIDIAKVLNVADRIPPLVVLLNLITTLTLNIPAFNSTLLLPRKGSVVITRDPPPMVDVLCEIIRNQLVPSKDHTTTGYSAELSSLAEETLRLLEALCWNVPVELEETLASISRSRGVLSILLNDSQPSWLVSRTCRLLVLLASHHSLFRHLLAFPDSENGDETEEVKDFSRIPHVEQICCLLVDTERTDSQAESIKDSILTFIATLSISHPDALTILLESQTLIPSLVLFLTRLTSLVWEDDETLMESPEQATSTLRTVKQALCLLHTLVYSPDPVFNLRNKFQFAPRQRFNGIMHMFIVTFGRLGYAAPPDWISPASKLNLVHIAELARDLLDLVVEGPEGDTVWATFQDDPDESSQTDNDEELEARLLEQ